MPNVDEMFPSKYLKAADLGDATHNVTIVRIEQDEVGQEREKRWVLFFAGKEKGLVLNKTNTSMIADFYGKNTDNWIGKEIGIFKERVPFKGEIVDAIRVSRPIPAQQENPANEQAEAPF